MKSIDKVVFLGSKSLGLQVLRTVYGLRPESLSAVITFDDRTDVRSDLDGFKSFSESIKSLPTNSDNGVVGTWSPPIINSVASGTYTFTPSANQCANA